MQLEPRHIEALDQAESGIFHCDFCPYLELKELLADATPTACSRFRDLFTRFYGLNVGGLTDEFKNRFFEILFSDQVVLNGQPDFVGILNELSLIERRTGNCALPLSFVSKLVAMRRECSPIYDKHVLAFFNKRSLPSLADKCKRIEWFLGFLSDVERSYAAWAEDGRVRPILARLQTRDVRLSHCHNVRLLDLLVWRAGSAKLLKPGCEPTSCT